MIKHLKKVSHLSRIIFASILFFVVPLIFWICTTTLTARTEQEGLKFATQSIQRAAIQCYALEGAYPPDFDSLCERSGLRIDTDKYFVDYQYVAANLSPDITVLPREN